MNTTEWVVRLITQSTNCTILCLADASGVPQVEYLRLWKARSCRVELLSSSLPPSTLHSTLSSTPSFLGLSPVFNPTFQPPSSPGHPPHPRQQIPPHHHHLPSAFPPNRVYYRREHPKGTAISKRTPMCAEGSCFTIRVTGGRGRVGRLFWEKKGGGLGGGGVSWGLCAYRWSTTYGLITVGDRTRFGYDFLL